MMRIFVGLALFLAACGPLIPPPDGAMQPGPAMPAEDSCGAAPYANLIAQPATALEKVLILRQVRVIRPGDAVTLDFSATRINFHINDAGRIARISCG